MWPILGIDPLYFTPLDCPPRQFLFRFTEPKSRVEDSALFGSDGLEESCQHWKTFCLRTRAVPWHLGHRADQNRPEAVSWHPFFENVIFHTYISSPSFFWVFTSPAKLVSVETLDACSRSVVPAKTPNKKTKRHTPFQVCSTCKTCSWPCKIEKETKLAVFALQCLPCLRLARPATIKKQRHRISLANNANYTYKLLGLCIATWHMRMVFTRRYESTPWFGKRVLRTVFSSFLLSCLKWWCSCFGPCVAFSLN